MTKVSLSTMIVNVVWIGLSFFSIGVGSPVPLSVSEVVVTITAFVSILIFKRVLLNRQSLILLFLCLYFICGAALIGEIDWIEFGKSFLRLLYWVSAFICLSLPFSYADYGVVMRRVLIYSAFLSGLHFVQLAQVYLGAEPCLVFPRQFWYRSAPSWFNPSIGWRPAAIFSEVSWYAIYQATVVAAALVWMPDWTRKRASRHFAVSVTIISVLVSRSFAGEVLVCVAVSFAALRAIRQKRVLGKSGNLIPLLILICGVGIGVFMSLDYVASRATLVAGVGSTTKRLIEPAYRVVSAIQINPFFGVGLGQEGKEKEVHGLDMIVAPYEDNEKVVNSIAHILIVGGIGGFSIFLAFLLACGNWGGEGSFVGFLWLLGLFMTHGETLLPMMWVPILLWCGISSFSLRVGRLRKVWWPAFVPLGRIIHDKPEKTFFRVSGG